MTTTTLFDDITAETKVLDLIQDLLGGRVIEETPAVTWRGFDDREDYEDRKAFELLAEQNGLPTEW